MLKYKIDENTDILKQVEKQIVEPNNRVIERTPLPVAEMSPDARRLLNEKLTAGFRMPQFATQLEDLNKPH